MMAPARVEPRIGAPKTVPFPDLMDLRNQVPGSSFESTETRRTDGHHFVSFAEIQIFHRDPAVKMSLTTALTQWRQSTQGPALRP